MAHEKVFKTVEEARRLFNPGLTRFQLIWAVVLSHTVTMMAITCLVGKMLVTGFMEHI